MTTLGDEFPKQQQRVRELIEVYKSLPNNAGLFGALMLENVLQRANRAAMSGDVVEMIKSYNEMKDCK